MLHVTHFLWRTSLRSLTFTVSLSRAVLLVFYVVCWLAVGRDPKIENVAPRYEPPAGISPGVARYILTGGSDGTTLAAVLAGLAAKGVVAIQPQSGSYAVSLLNSSPILLPDEAVSYKNSLQRRLHSAAIC